MQYAYIIYYYKLFIYIYKIYELIITKVSQYLISDNYLKNKNVPTFTYVMIMNIYNFINKNFNTL